MVSGNVVIEIAMIEVELTVDAECASGIPYRISIKLAIGDFDGRVPCGIVDGSTGTVTVRFGIFVLRKSTVFHLNAHFCLVSVGITDGTAFPTGILVELAVEYGHVLSSF